MVAGLAVREGNFDPFAKACRNAARELLSDEALQPCLRLDHELAFTEIDVDFLRWHEMLQPFGNGNPQPLFLAREVEPVAQGTADRKSTRLNSSHLGISYAVFCLKKKKTQHTTDRNADTARLSTHNP